MKTAFFSILTVAALAANAGATVLVDDNFTLSSGTDVGTVSNTESQGVGQYVNNYTPTGGTPGMTVTTVSGFGSGNVLALSSSINSYYRAFDGDATLTLAGLAVNDILRLQFDVQFSGTFVQTDNFSFGFVNSTTAIAYTNLDLLNGGGSAGSEFKYRNNANGQYMGEGGSTVGGTFNAYATTGVSYSFRMDITKTDTGTYLLEYYRDGDLLGSTSTSSLPTASTSITGISFRHGTGPGVVTYLDNVVVSTVPEPSAIALIFGCAAGAFLFRNRLRRMAQA